MIASKSATLIVDKPVNSPLSAFEFVARNIYETSQYSHNKLKNNRFYPNFRRESRDFPGRHVCRISVQRLCLAKWEKAILYANKTKSEAQQLVGFDIAPCAECLAAGFTLEPHAHERNPFHAHIYIRELDKPFDQAKDVMDSIMSSCVKHRLDNMTRRFKFYSIEQISTDSINESEQCRVCLKD